MSSLSVDQLNLCLYYLAPTFGTKLVLKNLLNFLILVIYFYYGLTNNASMVTSQSL